MSNPSQNPWQVLGIDPTNNEREIKKAYAQRLKQTNPETNPEQFMLLRESFERAKTYAAQNAVPAIKEETVAENSDENNHSAPVPPVDVRHESQVDLLKNIYHTLTNIGENEFLAAVKLAQQDDLFSTLDEQYFLQGEVICMLASLGSIAEVTLDQIVKLFKFALDENIFRFNQRYSGAFQYVFGPYVRKKQQIAIPEIEVLDPLRAEPGFDYVYTILTGRFDPEKLNTLLRSARYFPIASGVIERAETNHEILIPEETIDWWHRSSVVNRQDQLVEPKPKATRAKVKIKPASTWFNYRVFWFIFVALGFMHNISNSNHYSTDYNINPSSNYSAPPSATVHSPSSNSQNTDQKIKTMDSIITTTSKPTLSGAGTFSSEFKAPPVPTSAPTLESIRQLNAPVNNKPKDSRNPYGLQDFKQ